MKRSNVAQMVLQRFPCGCTIEDLGDGSHAINYCPKHKAAPDMYEALGRLIEVTDLLDTEECDHDVGICWCSYKNVRLNAAQALAKAEGKC